VRGEDGVEITFKQIAGLLARRIVFKLREGDTVERGQRVGLIKFGSRVNVLLPAQAELRVRVGQRVKGGESVLATMASGVSTVNQSMSAKALPNKSDGGRS
jgi:phosphatidylserine decarboxylase